MPERRAREKAVSRKGAKAQSRSKGDMWLLSLHVFLASFLCAFAPLREMVFSYKLNHF
jgi:hypothetical protein